MKSQGKIKEHFSSSECPIFLKRPYLLYSLVESNKGEDMYICKLEASFVLFLTQPYHRCVSIQKARTANACFKAKKERCFVQLLSTR